MRGELPSIIDNVAPTQAWEALQAEANARLVAVRTERSGTSPAFPICTRPEADSSEFLASVSGNTLQRQLQG
jgi:hypothetical protein